MRFTDIAIVGGGLAGSTLAATLGRAGIPAILIDPHTVYPRTFRVFSFATLTRPVGPFLVANEI